MKYLFLNLQRDKNIHRCNIQTLIHQDKTCDLVCKVLIGSPILLARLFALLYKGSFEKLKHLILNWCIRLPIRKTAHSPSYL